MFFKEKAAGNNYRAALAELLHFAATTAFFHLAAAPAFFHFFFRHRCTATTALFHFIFVGAAFAFAALAFFQFAAATAFVHFFVDCGKLLRGVDIGHCKRIFTGLNGGRHT